MRRTQSLPCEQQDGDDQAGAFLHGYDVDFQYHPLTFALLPTGPRLKAKSSHTHCRSMSPPRLPLFASATFGDNAVALFHGPRKSFLRSHQYCVGVGGAEQRGGGVMMIVKVGKVWTYLSRSTVNDAAGFATLASLASHRTCGRIHIGCHESDGAGCRDDPLDRSVIAVSAPLPSVPPPPRDRKLGANRGGFGRILVLLVQAGGQGAPLTSVGKGFSAPNKSVFIPSISSPLLLRAPSHCVLVLASVPCVNVGRRLAGEDWVEVQGLSSASNADVSTTDGVETDPSTM